MSGISVKVDMGDWSKAMTVYKRLAKSEGSKANLEAAKSIRDTERALLHASEHAPGTKTPSAPGAPPASISGRLAASVKARRDGDSAVVGPDTVYARIQEKGGLMRGHPKMAWIEDGVFHTSRAHSLPPRPYHSKAVDMTIASGDVTKAYLIHWTLAADKAFG